MSKIMIFKLCFSIDYALKDYLSMITVVCVTSVRNVHVCH